MTNRFDISKAPLRPEPRHPAAAAPIQSVPATPGGLIRSTLLAAGAAGAILVLFWLPAEYGIDPTGVGGLTGLTEMGEIKQQLAAEAEADVQAAAAAPVAAVENTPATAAPAPEILERLDRIDAQLAAISAVIGTPPSLTEPAAAATVVAEPAPEAAAAPAPDPVEAAVAEAAAPEPATPEWRDEVSYTLNPGEGIEVKLSMEEGQTARFFWTANGSVVNFDLHGDGSGESISYEQGRAVPEASGDLTAAFTGNHGWFWRNRTEAPVTVTLRTGGDYAEIKAP
ncbi:hypothetical protein GU927_013240 [Rhodobacteraceae bacterium HSP-20]|uniref:Transmembrane anchor protein n=1 Tax=Paragemmobacter amnigenus TaxID=2852097 RepID=A0ABS6J4Y5_9RHOB|nr:hypothetical protein [Rhodobacter amnigenus]MBU9698809.1 hypothetical protein [Rhodobacter amnigenus]MBV4390036.1 hypothetical protein [Rhodobacter amnigenus]